MFESPWRATLGRNTFLNRRHSTSVPLPRRTPLTRWKWGDPSPVTPTAREVV
jgi:hypothetical protein